CCTTPTPTRTGVRGWTAIGLSSDAASGRGPAGGGCCRVLRREAIRAGTDSRRARLLARLHQRVRRRALPRVLPGRARVARDLPRCPRPAGPGGRDGGGGGGG